MNVLVKELKKKGAKRRDPEGLRVNARACVAHRTDAAIERWRVSLCNVKPLSRKGDVYDLVVAHALKTNFNPTL